MIFLVFFALKGVGNLFTGIIEDLGAVDSISRSDRGASLTLRTGLPVPRIGIGESIAVNGACLTVISKGRGRITMDVSAETLRRTTLDDLAPGDPVNLERCLTLEKMLGGHVVLGHIDGAGEVVAIEAEGSSRLFTFEAPAGVERYLIEKGSVAIDGISLTVFGIERTRFSCAIIPHTLKSTTLGTRKPGSRVNIEGDMFAKYVERMLEGRRAAPGESSRGQP
ncbi:MAG: riboflavin synthase [Candidatus Binataceae bacterium]